MTTNRSTVNHGYWKAQHVSGMSTCAPGEQANIRPAHERRRHNRLMWLFVRIPGALAMIATAAVTVAMLGISTP